MFTSFVCRRPWLAGAVLNWLTGTVIAESLQTAVFFEPYNARRWSTWRNAPVPTDIRLYKLFFSVEGVRWRYDGRNISECMRLALDCVLTAGAFKCRLLAGSVKHVR